ncbi:indole-3-glycerol phosphate synthase TrpC [Neobacillus sedimentimangrovi]|uniref:indole-3-glycerol phosphate synthase TrpC n=1 Tax=Neobacillus sedimentimangrovi TaxID=2699460 RepID=UPI0013D8BE87|nr:indole-3-glycerol phosphate synthase TrpC [Neobacillus sedimentimangrovi]
MTTILDQIIEKKKQEVILLREKQVPFQRGANQKKSFIEILQKAGEISVIAEFKRASPSKGMINNAFHPAKQAVLYEKNGAAAISVLTDETFFKGSFTDLNAVREAVDLPILCKDFIIDPVQIHHAFAHGADLILLIAAALEESQIKELYEYAKDLGLEVLVEIHNEIELEVALKVGAKLIGVNNRDLRTFQVSLDVTEILAPKVKESGAFLISESGIFEQADVARVRNAGANGILVGEAFMRSENLQQVFNDFRLPLLEERK